MGEFRKKPVVIEARQFNGTLFSSNGHPFPEFQELVDWCGGEIVHTEERLAFYPKIKIETLEGPHTASWGDWIIKGVKGEFYPCKPDVFELTYERVTPDQPATPDEDTAVRGKILAVLDRWDVNNWEHDGGIADDLLEATRRPVDTRPTMTISEARHGWSESPGTWPEWLASVAPIAITPDPAPAAEVPVVEDIPIDRETVHMLKWIMYDQDQQVFTVTAEDHKSIIRVKASDLRDTLAAALTKATDR